MKTRIISIAIAVLLLSFTFPALAGTTKLEHSETAKQAAQEVVKDTGAKEQFGKTASGDRLIDKAKSEASSKLDEMANQADSDELPETKKLFLDNLNDKS